MRRHTRDAVRQLVCHPADRERSSGPAASHAVLRPAERLAHGRAARADLEGRETPPAGDHARRGPHDRVAALALDSQRIWPDLGHPFRLAPGHVEAERVRGSAERARGDQSWDVLLLGKPRGTHREWELHCKYLFSFSVLPFPFRTRVRFVGILVMSLCFYSMARSARHFLARRTMRMTTSRGSSVSRLAKLTLLVRRRRVSKGRYSRSYFLTQVLRGSSRRSARRLATGRFICPSMCVLCLCSLPNTLTNHVHGLILAFAYAGRCGDRCLLVLFLFFFFTGLQIDSIDPAFAPATGTPETGGWSTRELRTILRGLDGLHIVSADIVEVAPAYDTNAELTTMAAADVSVSKSIKIPRVT